VNALKTALVHHVGGFGTSNFSKRWLHPTDLLSFSRSHNEFPPIGLEEGMSFSEESSVLVCVVVDNGG
jgi:hypothetical protein